MMAAAGATRTSAGRGPAAVTAAGGGSEAAGSDRCGAELGPGREGAGPATRAREIDGVFKMAGSRSGGREWEGCGQSGPRVPTGLEGRGEEG